MAEFRRLSNDEVDQIKRLRKSCTACGGDPERCREGTGVPDFDRLTGCRAFTEDGEIVTAPGPRQPWEPRPRSSEEQDAE